MALPELDPEARAAALAKATEARRMRAELKQMLKSGEVTLRQVLAQVDHADAIAKMRVVDVIGALPAYGPVKARNLMEQLDIAPTRRLRGLGPRQRSALLATFEGGS